MVFKEQEQAETIKNKLQSLTEIDLSSFWETGFANCPDPDRALINLERWLSVTANPGTNLAHLAEGPKLAALLIDLLGASQSVADGLIQNPELAAIITDPGQISTPPSKHEILSEGLALLSVAHSYAHRLDRLRYLKQRWRIPIVVADLAEIWTPEVVWSAISVLADVLIGLGLKVAWEEFAERKELTSECPISVVAFGKLGGGELNYSSDVDLVYVLDDEANEEMERQSARICEMISRALSDPMGRGSLYRVDLRLRPFGGAGPIAPTMGAIETYYRSHAELWEAQALIRSRLVCGDAALDARWQNLIEQNCFQKSVSDFRLGAIFDTRTRIEEAASEDDLKRGPGGIRDVEFLVQVLQMLHGHSHPAVRHGATLQAVRALEEARVLRPGQALALIEGYTFLRQLEHRCQIVDDQQTHSIPSSLEAKDHIARLMGHENWVSLEAELAFQRQQIREIYTAITEGGASEPSTRDEALSQLPPDVRAAVGAWFDSLPESQEFYRSLRDDAEGQHRVSAIADLTPTLLPLLSKSVTVTEEILSGEAEEVGCLKLPALQENKPEELLTAAQTAWLHRVVGGSLDPASALGPSLSAVYDALLSNVALAKGATFDVIALGSYGLMDVGIDSDLDILLLVADENSHEMAEDQAQSFLATLTSFKRFGWKVTVDLRLRPEGNQGLLVRSHQGLRSYELERMEMWERFALGQARLVFGREESYAVTQRVAYAIPLTPENLQELVTMKRRIETERVQPQHFKRELKLGYGGLSDIDWLVHLFEMRYPTALEVGKHILSADRIRRMAQVQLINTFERDHLLAAREHLLRARNHLSLLGFVPDVLPENPDKLERLASAMGLTSGYEFQERHASIIEGVRAIYLEGLDRLGV